MKNLIFILVFIITGCEICDFSITPNKRALLAHYQIGDTLYFQSQKGDIDTISIVSIDSVEVCGSVMTGKRKEIAIEIQHHPLNKWTGGTNGTAHILNQNLIAIVKQFDEKDAYWVGINYRNFLGELTPNHLQANNYLADLNITEYWNIENEAANWDRYKNDTTLITRIIWTQEYGLTEYTKRNGEILRIKKTLRLFLVL